MVIGRFKVDQRQAQSSDQLARPGSLRAVRLDRSLDPEALYLFTMIKKTPPADLEIWYRRVATTPAPA